MKKCVVSFADENGSYRKKLLRLEQSLKGNFDGDFLGFTSYDQIGCEPHSVIPYKFKPYAIQKAIDMGYELILWCDSPIYAKKPLNDLMNHIEKYGYIFFDNIGHSLGDWSKDSTLSHFGLTRDQAWSIKSIMACCMGFNMNFDLKYVGQSIVSTKLLLGNYKGLADKLYPGDWSNDDLSVSKDRRVKGSRHDQEVMSALINLYSLNITKGQDTFFCYESHREVMPIADSVCLFSG